MALHSRRPPAPPAPEFYIAEPEVPRAPGTPPAEPREAPAPPAPGATASAAPAVVAARPGAAHSWHRGERWAVAMLVSFALMLGAILVPGRVKLVLVGLSALAAVAGIVMLARQGVFDEPPPRDG